MRPVLLSLLAAGAAGQTTAVSKVIDLLNNLLAESEKGLADEKAASTHFDGECTREETRLNGNIANAEGTILVEDGNIQRLKAAIKKNSISLKEDQTTLSYEERNLESGEEVREQENADFLATEQDYSESITALKEAQNVLNARKGVASFMQVKATIKNAAVQAVLAQEEPKVYETDQRVRENYGKEEGAIQRVIKLLGDVQREFEDKHKELTDDNRDAVQFSHRYFKATRKEISNLKGTIAGLETQIGKETKLKGEAEQNKADAEEEKKINEEQLSSTGAHCSVNKDTFTAQIKLRTDEVAAINQALNILSDGNVAESAHHLNQADAAATGESFLQIASSLKASMRGDYNEEADPVVVEMHKVTALLSRDAKAYNSKMLSLLATQVAATSAMGANPLYRVAEMIRKMISQLMQESTLEAEQHGECESQLAENKIEREYKQEVLDELNAEDEKLRADLAQLTLEVEDLGQQYTDLEADRSVARQDRGADKKMNAATIADSKLAQQALRDATAVLKQFYTGNEYHDGEGNYGGAQEAQDAVEVEQASRTGNYKGNLGGAVAYGGNKGKANSVLDMLEIVSRDYVRLEEDTVAAEANALAAHTEYMNKSEVEIAKMSTSKDLKNSQMTDKFTALDSCIKELDSTTEELQAAKDLYTNVLKPKCVDTQLAYEDTKDKDGNVVQGRKSLRERELESMRDAVEILKTANKNVADRNEQRASDEDAAAQQAAADSQQAANEAAASAETGDSAANAADTGDAV